MSLVKGPPVPGSRWKHYMGGFHTVVCVAHRRGSAEPLVIHKVARSAEHVATPLTEWQGRVGMGLARYAPAGAAAEPLKR
jgi:hypothetical protein